MKKGKVITFSVIGSVICSILCFGCLTSNKSVDVVQVNMEEYNARLKDEQKQSLEIEDYWNNTSMNEIRTSILGYVNDMMNSTLVKLEDFKKEENEPKIKLYEGEVKRLKLILKNVKSAETKEDLRKAIQVSYKQCL